MTVGDLIYCYTCKGITPDTNKSNLQDGRKNPHWNYRCGNCHSFRTINASQFLDSGQTESMVALEVGKNPETLKALGRLLKARQIIKEFRVQPIRNGRFKLYERRRTKREILKALKNWGETESFI